MANGSPKSPNKLKVLLIYIAVFMVLSIYLGCMVHALLNGYAASCFNPVSMYKCIRENGFPTGKILLFAIILAILCGYSYARFYIESKSKDKMGRNFNMSSKRQTYGDVHFEEPQEYEQAALIQGPKKATGTILGQLDQTGKQLINFRMDKKNRLNQNIAVFGASGTGKTFSFSKPFCFQTVKRRESIIITDPDGGLYRDVAGYFQDNGYIVRRFDLNKLTKSDGWDCLKSVMGDNVELDAQLFSQIVITNSVKDPNNIYGQGPLSLLKALVLRVVLGHDYPPEQKNIESVYALIQNVRGEEYLDEIFNADNLWEEELPCLGPYLTFKQGSPNLRGNIITNLAVQLQLLQNKLVCKVLSTDDIDLTLPATQPCAYFCVFPDNHDTYRFIVSLFFSMLFIKLINFADDQPDGRCPVPVRFLLDEFPSIGQIPDFDRKMATIRKRAISVAMIFQDITQLQNNYPTTWVTLLSNCATWLSIGINDEYTSSLVNKRVGETTVQVQTEQHQAEETLFKLFHNRSIGEGKRSLLSFDELFRVGVDECIILFQGHNPIWAYKYPFDLHPDASKLRPILPQDIPDITDVKEREKFRERENKAVERYLSEHPLSEVDRSYAGECESEYNLSPTAKIKKYISEHIGKKKAVEQSEDEEAPVSLDEDDLDFFDLDMEDADETADSKIKRICDDLSENISVGREEAKIDNTSQELPREPEKESEKSPEALPNQNQRKQEDEPNTMREAPKPTGPKAANPPDFGGSKRNYKPKAKVPEQQNNLNNDSPSLPYSRAPRT